MQTYQKIHRKKGGKNTHTEMQLNFQDFKGANWTELAQWFVLDTVMKQAGNFLM
jgi:hypothetical protein